MDIVEYKKHLKDGVHADPEWIIKGTLLSGDSDFTWIGLVDSAGVRPYYIPDTVKYKSLADVQAIHRTKGMIRPTDSADPHSTIIDMSDSDIDAKVLQILTDAGY